jgi:Zn-dependent metalloprotease
MKKLIITLLLLPLVGLAQNPLDLRSANKPNAKAPNIDAEIIDGRNSDKPSFSTPIPFQTPTNTGAAAVKYQLKRETVHQLPIQLNILQPTAPTGFGVNITQEVISLQTILADMPGLFGWGENTSLVETEKITDDEGFTHIRYQQVINDILVQGGEWILHLTNGAVTSGNGRIYPSCAFDFNATVSSSQATSIAESYIYTYVKAYQESAYDNVLVRSTIIHKAIDYDVSPTFEAVLVYIVEVRPTAMHHYRVYINATTGEVLKTLDELCSIDGPKTATAIDLNNKSQTVNSYQVGSTYYMVNATKSMWTNSQPSGFPDNPIGAIWTIDARNTDGTSIVHVSSSTNSWSDKSSVSAHVNAGLAFDYFKNTHARNSINGSGGSIISVVNVTDGGSAMDNAYWNGQAIFYGNGASAFKPLAGALDVAGHELTHGVVSKSANLEYQGQSGALNESMADVFGAMIDRDDWKMGEDIVKAGVFAGGALRDLANPHNGGTSLSNRGYQPAKMSEYYTGSQDNGGVHINSGIVNRAYYLAATGTNMSKEMAEKIWYRALTKYLTSKSQFLDLRYACLTAAQDLYDGTQETDAVAAIKNAFDIVEIFDPNGNSGGGSGGSGGTGDLPINPGIENIISLDVNVSNSNTWYKSSTVPNAYVALSTTSPLRKGSVTDKGDYMFYVTAYNELNRIQLNSPYTESTLSTEDWNNVAISKDGKRLAAITTNEDGKIWIYDFVTSTWKSFVLYNPTYTEGVDAGSVNYADAIEFDNTGQFLLYDAQNKITNSSGNNLQWWDVGVIRVWDNTTNGFGDGKIEKVFSQLPAGVSIGNATYSKNSPYIIAYDYVTSSSYSVVATNTQTGASGTIYTQDILGFPNFSNKDDKMIFDAEYNGSEIIAIIDLASTKIGPKSGSSALVHIEDGKWGTWYANGTRSLLSDKKDLLSFSFPNLSGSPQGVYTGTTIDVNVPLGTPLASLIPAFTNSADARVTVAAAIQTSGVTPNNFGNNVIYTVAAQDGTTKNYTVKVHLVAGISDLEKSINIYPNPATNRVLIESTFSIDHVKCFTINGEQVHTTYSNGVVDIAGLASGMYYIQIETAQGTLTKRVIKL